MGRGRAPCCDKTKVRTGPWTPEEDLRLMNFIQKHGHSNWRALPKQAGLLRCGKSCRLRWINYLRPDVKRGNFTPEEENAIIELHNSFGNKWSKIASCLPGRTDNEIKNVWNTHLKKRLVTKKSTMDCHKTQGNDSKMDYSSASSSSSTTTSTDEKIRGDEQGVHETQVKKPDEQPDFLKENAFSDSPSSSCVSNFSHSNGPKPELAHSESSEAAIAELGGLDNGKTDIPSEFDVDFWELMDSLDPLQSSETAENGGTNLSSVEEKIDEVEFSKWLRFLENELGLTSEDGVKANPQFEEMSFEPEIGTALFDYSSTWPCSPPHYLGI